AQFSVTADALIAVTGADCELRVGDAVAPSWEPVSVRAGQTISLQQIRGGMRCYVAVHGSFEVPTLLGSCAPDPAIGFGTTLERNSRIPLRQPSGAPVSEYWGRSLHNLQVLRPYFGETAVVDVIDGPDISEFEGTAEHLFEEPYTVTEKSNHVGLRLSGGPIPVRTSRDEKLSRGVPIGALEGHRAGPGDPVHPCVERRADGPPPARGARVRQPRSQPPLPGTTSSRRRSPAPDPRRPPDVQPRREEHRECPMKTIRPPWS